LRLNALRGVHHKQRALAGSNGAANFVTKIHVTWRVYKIERICLIGKPVIHLYGVAFDGDAFFAFQFHIVKDLGFHIAFGNGVREFQQAVGKGAFAVINVCNDAKIADVVHSCVGLLAAKVGIFW
jgi:hypothetical protein